MIFRICSLLILVPVLLLGQKVVLPAKIDDFAAPRGWWDYRAIGTVKADSRAFQWHNGVLKIRLRNPESSRMCDVGFAERQGIYKKRLPWLEAEIRVKVLNPMKPGSRGWGFWRMRVAGRPSSLAWFMEQMGPPNQLRFTWSKAGVISRKGRAETSISVPENQWQVYRVVRDRATRSTRFYINGQLVLQAPYYPIESLSFHCWIDNGVYHRKGVKWEGWTGESALVVDYVMIRTRREEVALIRNDPPVVLYRRLNLFGKPWSGWAATHKLTFQTTGKPVLLMATVRVEGPSAFARADQLTLTVDGAPVLFWKGEEASSQLSARLARVMLPEGRHTLQFSAVESPFIREVLIMEPDTVLLKKTVTPDNRPKWDYTFDVPRTGEVVLVIAGNARENPGWNHVVPESRDEHQDGDLTFRLDGEVLLQTICGNRVFGNGEMAIIRKTLSRGKHQLQIYREGPAQLLQVIILQ